MVGPGGVALVETKWGGTPWDADAGDIAFRTALEQTGRNAKQLALWHGVAKYGRPDVEPVLVVWGPAARQLRDFGARRHASGVVVMSGDHLREWMMGRRRDRLTPAQVDGIYAEMDRHLVRRDARERVTRPMPRSIADSSRPPWPASGSPFLMTNWLLQLTASVFAWIGTGLALAGAAEVLRRRTRRRWEARSFQIGLVALYLLTTGAVARVYLLS